MAFSRNAQRARKVSPQRPPIKPPKQAIFSSRGCANQIISTIRQLPENERDWSESMRHLLRELLQEENRSMEAILNSSINHFTQYVSQHDDMETQNHQLIRQNQNLTAAIEELRAILKQKLEAALRKQREDLNVMMQDYIQLIQKLLKDKEAFAVKLEQEERRADMVQDLVNAISEEQLKSHEVLKEKQIIIEGLQKKISDQAAIIEENRLQFQEIAKENEDLKTKIEQLELKSCSSTNNILDESQEHKEDANASKCKFLLQLLEQSEAEMKKMRERLRHETQNSPKDGIIEQLKYKIIQMEQEYEDQFKEYEQSMREVLERKDEQIEKLTKIIESTRRQHKNAAI